MTALVGSAAACGENVLPPTPPPPPPAPPVIAIVSGNGQEGKLGVTLSELLVVRVKDANGAAAPGKVVQWTVVAGAGQFGVAAAQTTTGADGTGAISFRPTGTNGYGVTVSAVVVGAGSAPVYFSFLVDVGSVPLKVVIPYGPNFDCTGGLDPSIFVPPQGPIPVGALVEWEYAPWLYPSCASQLRAVVVPAGALQF
jgi:hypothetical protein